jgi:hypothetical protein
MRYFLVDIGYEVPNMFTVSDEAEHAIKTYAGRNNCHWQSSGCGFGVRDVQLESHTAPPQSELDWLDSELRRHVTVTYLSSGWQEDPTDEELNSLGQA